MDKFNRGKIHTIFVERDIRNIRNVTVRPHTPASCVYCKGVLKATEMK